eukprot:gi/632972266/ref/XP_007902572.1/ PREDICTED: sorting nexin-11 [Callorhinchus milii]
MLNSQEEEEEFITVRVQDPRIQNQGSWNPYIEYKIFLYTNSKAFTVKTSCVRRRYREFVWLRRQLQRNAGLVSLPELPGKNPFFPVHNRERIERRRQGLQQFLEKVLHMTVFLSDTLLHLFMQTQLSPAEMEGCVLGQTPYSTTEAILSYAMSNKSALHEGDSAVVSTIAYECQSSPNRTQASVGESNSETVASNRVVGRPSSITQEVTPVSITPEVTPSSITPEGTPSSITQEGTPVSITPEVTPDSITQEVTPVSITPEVSPSSITQEVTPVSTPEVTPVSIKPEVTPVSITQEVTSSITQEQIPPSQITERHSPVYNGL